MKQQVGSVSMRRVKFISKSAITSTILVVGLFLLAYGYVLPPLVREWHEHVTYTYAFLIVPISVYLIWIQRDRLSRLPRRPSFLGLIPLTVAVLIGLFGSLIEDVFLVRVSMLLAIGSIVYVCFGKAFFKALLFPWGYLFFVVPAPYVFLKHLSHYLRFFDAIGAQTVLEWVGIPIYRDGYFLHLPAITLEVADVCSGISSIFALLALATLYAQFQPFGLGLKIVLAFSAVVFAVLINLFRIIVVSISVHLYGPVMLGAFFHHFTGTFIFVLSLLLILLFGEYLCRRSGNAPARPDPHDKLAADLRPPPSDGALSNRPLYAAVAIMLPMVVFSLGYADSPKFVSRTATFQGLANSMGPYSAVQSTGVVHYHDQNADNEIFQSYRGLNQTTIEVYVGYKKQQSSTNRLLSPKLHFPGGWNFVWVRSEQIEIPGRKPIQANWMLAQNGSEKQLVLYWYQLGSVSVSGELGFRLEQVKNVIFKGRRDGAVIRLATSVGGEESILPAQKAIIDFLAHFYPWLDGFLSSPENDGVQGRAVSVQGNGPQP